MISLGLFRTVKVKGCAYALAGRPESGSYGALSLAFAVVPTNTPKSTPACQWSTQVLHVTKIRAELAYKLLWSPALESKNAAAAARIES